MNAKTKNETFSPLSKLTVEKRGGNSEKFNEEKLIRGISRAWYTFHACQRHFKINN